MTDFVPQPFDFINDHARLRLRIKNILTGVTPLPFYPGEFGDNTPWMKLTPGGLWKYTDPDSYVRVRIRSDVMYLNMVGGGGVTPVSGSYPTYSQKQTGLYGIADQYAASKQPTAHEVFRLPAKTAVYWPSHAHRSYCLTNTGQATGMYVKPDGRIYFSPAADGSVIFRPGSCHFPHG